jgi:1-acyl-sn-glycerol-3-phosphate acyltransferase
MIKKQINEIIQSYIKKIEGLEHIPKKGGFIVAANHNNHLDSFILASLIHSKFNRKVKFLARKDIAIWRIIGQWGADQLSAILIDHKKRQESLDIAHEALKNGHIIGNYPEAQLNNDPQLLKPRSGTARLALWTGFPVIPTGISQGPGAHRGLDLFKDILFNFKNSTTIKFGKPLQFDKVKEKTISKDLLTKTSNEVMTAIAPLCEKTYNPSTTSFS